MLNIKPLQRHFLPADLKVNVWEDIAPYCEKLLAMPIDNVDDLEKFLRAESELEAVVSEESAKRYNAISCNSADPDAEKRYNDYLQTIMPKLAEYADKFNRRIVDSPYAGDVKIIGFALGFKGLKTQTEIFRAENIPLSTQIEELSAESGKIRGAMTVVIDGVEMTLPKLADRQFWPDRAKREEAWRASANRYYQDKDRLDDLFDRMVKLRTQVARNAGFDNYRDYKFKEMQRYDYGPEQALAFHAAIEKHIVPLVAKTQRKRMDAMGLDKLRPWDTAVDIKNRPALKAFASGRDLIDKSLIVFKNVDPLFHDTLQLMDQRGLLDLESRPNKRPGGYMNPMHESGVPFIFANVTEKVRDMVTLVHEVGHAVHEICVNDLPLMMNHGYPMEVAELASMSMELLTLDQWSVFFDKREDLLRAQEDHVKDTIGFLPWMAMVDAFQHEVYTNPDWTPAQRHEAWAALQQRFGTGLVDWSGLEDVRATGWQKQGHVFEVPFYYIEYGIAQLGALQVWRNYLRDPKTAVAQYKAALSLGYTKSIPEIYQTAGIKFDFSSNMLAEMATFVDEQLDRLQT